MNRRFLTTVFILACCFIFVRKSNACEQPPIAVISNPYSQTVCVGCEVEFDGSTSYDQDEEGNSIEVYYWNYSEDSNWHEDGEEPNHTFNTAGYYGVYLYVEDDEEVMSETYDSCVVYVVEVNEVVKQGTIDEGPIYLCPDDDTVSLEAEPYPVGASFPSGEPHWSIESQPSGADAQLNPSSGSATTTLSCLTEQGEYVIKAQCGDSDDGDTITVTNELQNETDWIDFPSDDIPNSCSAALCDGEDATIFDDCDNELEVSCAQADGTGGIGGCAYRYFYNDGLISSCIWVNGRNKWWYTEANIGDSSLTVFTKARHTTADPDKNDSEGCAGYYCSLVVIYDCITGADPCEYWRRDPDNIPWTETDGEGHECPGP